MSQPSLISSRKFLKQITSVTHSAPTAKVANAIWEKHLQADNPLWKFVTYKTFIIDSKTGSAHVMAMIDKRLPDVGLVGFFGCTNSDVGAEVLRKADSWLHAKHGIKNVYGPINGTATTDYRLNLAEDFCFPGEPVNPHFYIDAFTKAGFSDFNHYKSGISKRYQLLGKFFVVKPKTNKDITIRAFNVHDQLHDLKIYHQLMTTIFPELSLYCPKLSWDERLYNFKDKNPMFNDRYTYFLEHRGKPIGLIVAYPYGKNLIIKTIGIVSEYRGKHLANILVRKVYDVAARDSLNTCVYAMVRLGNDVHKSRRPGTKLFRHYVTMKKSF